MKLRVGLKRSGCKSEHRLRSANMSTHDNSMFSSFTWTSILIICVCVVDSVTIAYDGSLMGTLNVMPAYSSYFHLTTTTKSLNTAITFVGAIPVALIAGPMINWKGRRFGIYLSACIQILGAILQGSAQHIAMFIIGRFFIGAGSGLAQTAASTYVAETVPSRIRAFALGLYFTCWGVGGLLAAGVCYGVSNTKRINGRYSQNYNRLLNSWSQLGRGGFHPCYKPLHRSAPSLYSSSYPSHRDGCAIRTVMPKL